MTLLRNSGRLAEKVESASELPEESPQTSTAAVEPELEEDIVEEEPMEVDELDNDMKDFFEKTRQHKIERERVKAEIELKKKQSKEWLKEDEEELVFVENVGVYERKPVGAAQNEHEQTMQRREEAKKMYGQKSDKILAMETVLQLKFDQAYESLKPPLWPNIPMRF